MAWPFTNNKSMDWSKGKITGTPPIIHWKIYDYNWYFGPQLQSMGYIMIYSLFYQHI